MDSGQITRNVYYYDLFTHSRDAETNEFRIDRSSQIINKFFSDIFEKQSGKKNYKDFIVHTTQGDEFLIVDSKEQSEIRFRIVLCRENALPYIEKNGELEALGNYISNDQNIAEVTHCVFFPEYGVLGAEYNNNGARATSIPEYIVKRTQTGSMPTCHAKLNYDAYEKLIQEETYTLFDFSVVTDSEAYNKVLSKKSIFSAIQATVPESDTMEVVLRKRKTKKNKNQGFSLPLTLEEIKDLITNYREDIHKLNVSQGKMSEKVDLLSDKFVGKVFLAKTSNRMIDSEGMYSFISEFFATDVRMHCKKWGG